MKNQKIRRKIIRVVLIIILVIGLATIPALYVKSIQELLFLEANSHLKEIAVQSSSRIEEKLYNKLDILTLLSKDIQNFEGYTESEKAEKLKIWCGGDAFLQIGYADIFGNGLNSRGEHINILTQDYFKEAIKGKSYVSDVVRLLDGYSGNMILISVPYVSAGRTQGIIYGLFEVESVADLLNFDFFEGKGYEFILDKRGNIVAHPEEKFINKNVFYEISKYNNSIETQIIKLGFLKDKEASGVYFTEKGRQYVYYVPITFNHKDLNISAVTVIPYDAIFGHSQKVLYQTIGFIIMNFLLFWMIMLYILKQKKTNLKMLKKVAYEDLLCDISNRNGLMLKAADFLKANSRKKTAIYIDIDNFKIINSIFGYDFGDEVLIHMAGFLKATFNKEALIGRIDADKFCVLTSYESQNEIFAKIENIIHAINSKYLVHKEIILSSGIYFIEGESEEFDLILDKAHLANKSMKYFRKKPYAIYNEELTKSINEENWLVEEMRKAIDYQGFEVYYQPQFELETEKIVGSEALIRWNHEQRGFIGPAEFIPVAEKTQLIVDIGRFVFERVCQDIASWKKNGIPLLPVAVNLSRVELYQKDVVDFIKNTVKKYELDFKFIHIEITETVAMNEYEDIESIIASINNLGILVSIDDFGSGYSSLGCLQKFTVDTLKLDRSFLVNIETDKKGINILSGMVELSRILGLKAICEGIETREQLEMLKEMNCKFGQGYIFARPMPKSDYENFVVSNIEK